MSKIQTKLHIWVWKSFIHQMHNLYKFFVYGKKNLKSPIPDNVKTAKNRTANLLDLRRGRPKFNLHRYVQKWIDPDHKTNNIHKMALLVGRTNWNPYLLLHVARPGRPQAKRSTRDESTSFPGNQRHKKRRRSDTGKSLECQEHSATKLNVHQHFSAHKFPYKFLPIKSNNKFCEKTLMIK
jgi:hypothetical protein